MSHRLWFVLHCWPSRLNPGLVAMCLGLWAITVPGLSPAQTPAESAMSAPPTRAIEYASVADALASLSAHDGAGTVVTHSDGWVIINQVGAQAQWSFTPSGHAAYPAVVRRTIRRSNNAAVSVEVVSLCEAVQESCDKLLKEFEAMNDRIVQSIRARSRQGSTPR
jgi:hypothetical protein